MTFSWQYSHIDGITYKPSKLGQTDLFFGTCSGYDLCNPG